MDTSTHFRFTAKWTEDPSGCWLWTGKLWRAGGYGGMRVDGRNESAHRLAYEHYRGPVPPGMQLDHLCRVRKCVNPWHLEVVSSAENTARGLVGQGSNRGEGSGRATLTDKQVLAIRADTRIQMLIAKTYGVSPCQISRIKRRVQWTHL